MADYTPIDCDLHDHVEVACLFRYKLRLSTCDDQIICGTAVGTETDRDKQEWLLLDGDVKRIRLDHIRTMEPMTPGARFQKVDFANP